MWVCFCNAVTDRQICAAVAEGATTTREVAMRCRAGASCRACLPEVRRIVCNEARKKGLVTEVKDRELVGVGPSQ
jgi:nitrite reductase (NADH) large subunit